MNHRTRVYDSILELLSDAENPTPLVRLRRVIPFRHAAVYAKLEWYNPFGSVKDRVAANLVRDANEHGRLAEGVRLVEPTSGNTGMALAMFARAIPHRPVSYIADSRSLLHTNQAVLPSTNDRRRPRALPRSTGAHLSSAGGGAAVALNDLALRVGLRSHPRRKEAAP